MKLPLDEDGYAPLAAKLLSEKAPPPVVGNAIGDRAAVIGAVERALRSRRRVRQLWISASIVGSTAVVVVGIVWLAARTTGTLTRPLEAKRSDRDAPMASRGSTLTITGVRGAGASVKIREGLGAAVVGARVIPGASLEAAADGDLVAALDSGTSLRVAAGGRIRVAELGAMQRFVLEAGALEAKVAKLDAGHRFIVITPDAEVEVRGTEFEIALAQEPADCAPNVRTRVTVREGVVSVRHPAGETRVAAGSGWPTCAPRAETPFFVRRSPTGRAASSRPSGAAVAAAKEAKPVATAEVGAPADSRPGSTLSEQNDLFAAALAARRRGDVDEALRWLDRLLARYPNGQLLDSARAERQRLVAGTRQAGRTE